MRIGPCTVLLALILAPSLLSQTASAQTTQTAAPASSTTPAAAPACSCTSPLPLASQHVQPYSYKQKTTHIQTLADGTTITNVTDSQMWRDAEGRTRNETIRTQNGEVIHSFQIFDYITQTRYTWTVGANAPQIVTVFRPRPIQQPVAQPAPINPQPIRRYVPQITQSLPPQTIAGVYATGFLRTTTTPAGYEGNDHDIVVTDEIWNAPDPGIVVRRIFDDPRTGKTITETTDIQLTAPDPALFKVPEGYEVRDTNPTPASSATPAACNCTTPIVQHVLPYIAIRRSTNVQIQANGTTITTITQTHIWRDDAGRTRTENFGTLPDGTTSYGDTNLYDPVERVRMSWSIGDSNDPKILTVHHFPQPASQPASPAPGNPQPARRYFPQRTETLPPQTIDGLYATGIRTTRTIPAGYVGNDHDLTTTTESWVAQPLGIVLRSISEDPRTGKITTEFTDIQQTVPDSSLFKAPEGYQVRETNP